MGRACMTTRRASQAEGARHTPVEDIPDGVGFGHVSLMHSLCTDGQCPQPLHITEMTAQPRTLLQGVGVYLLQRDRRA